MLRHRSNRRLAFSVITKLLLFIPHLIFVVIFITFRLFTRLAKKLFHKTGKHSPSLRKITIDYRYGLILAVPLVLFLVFNSSYFRVRNISVSWSNPNFSIPSVENVYKSENIGKNIFLISRPSLLKAAKNEPIISDVLPIKKYPSNLLIDIKTREPFLEGLWVNKEKESSISSLIRTNFFDSFINQSSASAQTYLLDKEGLVFWRNSKPVVGFPLFFFVDSPIPELGERVAGSQNRDGFRFVEALIGKTETKSLPKLSFMVSDTEQLVAKFASGPYVFLPHQSSYDELLDSLRLILDKYHIEGKVLKKVDLRFNNPVVEY